MNVAAALWSMFQVYPLRVNVDVPATYLTLVHSIILAPSKYRCHAFEHLAQVEIKEFEHLFQVQFYNILGISSMLLVCDCS